MTEPIATLGHDLRRIIDSALGELQAIPNLPPYTGDNPQAVNIVWHYATSTRNATLDADLRHKFNEVFERMRLRAVSAYDVCIQEQTKLEDSISPSATLRQLTEDRERFRGIEESDWARLPWGLSDVVEGRRPRNSY